MCKLCALRMKSYIFSRILLHLFPYFDYRKFLIFFFTKILITLHSI